MYKVSRFFVSDIVAGENLLRNGYFPVFREDEPADHGIIVAANGSCKTTLLSFLFSVFTPDRRRFVQYLQSGGDKALEQYLVPDRPALVMLHLSINLDPTLFETQPREHLVLGQLLHRKKSAPDKIERSYFVASEWQLFDQLRMEWEKISHDDHPHTAARTFINGKVFQTGSQTEWETHLESLGLDPWLVNRQVDFSRSEGGIKESFKFKSEEAFLSFFLGCVSDLESAMALRKNTIQTMEKMKNRPEKKKQLKAVHDLKKSMEAFHGWGEQWRIARSEMETCTARLGEAVHLLTLARKEARAGLEVSESAVQKNGERQKAEKIALETARANQVVVEETGHALETDRLKRLIRESTEQVEMCQKERVALKAADYMAFLWQCRAEVESREKILAGKDSLLEPARKQMELRAAQYHARLLSQRMEMESALKSMEGEKEAAEERLKSLKEKLQNQAGEMLTLNGDLARLSAQLKAAGTARDNLGLVAGDEPGEALTGLEKEVQNCKESLDRITARLQELHQRQIRTENRWQQLHRIRIQGEETLKRARDLQAGEKAQRDRLLGNLHLQTVAGSATFEPTRADLATRLAESLARTRTRTEQLQMRLLETGNELKHLKNMDALVVDAPVAQLMAHYIDHGISPDELKPFPDYLAGLDKTPEEIAGMMSRDPGRFTGIMAVTDEVIEKVQALPVPEWLHKPVVISTPRDLDRNLDQGLEFPVIAPTNPMVYSRRFLKEQKEKLNRREETLKEQVAERFLRIRSLESAEKQLTAYRKMYPDMAAVEQLARDVAAAGEAQVSIVSEIRGVEAEREAHTAGKKEQEARFQTETRTLAGLELQVKQVKNWLAQYGAMGDWEGDLSRGEIRRMEMNHEMTRTRDAEKEAGASLTRLHGAMAEKKARLESLEERADDLPVTREVVLTRKQREQALSMDLATLRRQHEQAHNDVIRIAGDLGIEGLRGELQRVREQCRKTEKDLDRYGRKTPFDQPLAEKWAGKSGRERDDRTAALSSLLEDLKEKRAGYRGQLEGRERDLARCRERRKALSGKNIYGDIDPAEIENSDLEELIRHYGREAQTREEKLERLKVQGEARAADLEQKHQWDNEIKLALALVSGQAPCWDTLSPRVEWVELVRAENPVESAVAFRKQMEDIRSARTQMVSLMEARRKDMGRAFDRLQGELRDDTLKRQLPAIVDELSRHDAESLGSQSGELMEKCSHIAANIEGDLSRSAQFVESLVDQLFQHVRVCHQKVLNAAKQLMPDNVFVYGGKPILKAGTRLDFTRHADIFRKSIDHWLDELIQKNYVPEVNARAGDTLGTELLYRLLRISSAKQEFGIRLLKCDDTGRNYEPVGKDLGSGGEALTTAVLLYSLLTAMRQKRRNRKEDRIPAFLLADNPLGVCNRSDFLDTQLKVARAMGIQCIYFTGINDRESLALFQHRVAIRHSGRHLNVGGKPYNCLEVIEQNVEVRQ